MYYVLKINGWPFLLAVFLLSMWPDEGFSCCDETFKFRIHGVVKEDALNIRQFPNHKAKIVGRIPGNTPQLVIIYETNTNSYTCLNGPFNDSKLLTKFLKAGERQYTDPQFAKLKSLLVSPSTVGKNDKNIWCEVSFGKDHGWVNTRYLRHVCTETVGETGVRHSTCPKSK